MQVEQNSTPGGSNVAEAPWRDHGRGRGSGPRNNWQGSHDGSQDGSRGGGRSSSFVRRDGRQGYGGRGGRGAEGQSYSSGRGFGRGRFVERQGEGQQWENSPRGGRGADRYGEGQQHWENAPPYDSSRVTEQLVHHSVDDGVSRQELTRHGGPSADAGLLGNGPPQASKYVPRQGSGSHVVSERKGERYRGHEDRGGNSTQGARGGSAADGQRGSGRGRNWRQHSRGAGGAKDRMQSGHQDVQSSGEGVGAGGGVPAIGNGAGNLAPGPVVDTDRLHSEEALHVTEAAVDGELGIAGGRKKNGIAAGRKVFGASPPPPSTTVGKAEGIAPSAIGPFLLYLPQDDAVASGSVSGLGFDSSLTQEVVDILNRRLSALLKLKARDFWKTVASERTLPEFLDSFLRFRRRPFDYKDASTGPSGTVTGVVAGDVELARRVLMVLLRLSSNCEGGMVVFPAHEHVGLLTSRRLLTVPILMDVCAIYGRSNPGLSRTLIRNAVAALPSFRNEVAGTVAPLVRTVASLRVRTADAVKAILDGGRATRGGGAAADADVASAKAAKDLLEVATYLHDVAATLAAFVEVHTPAARALVCAEARDGGSVGPLLGTLASAHDAMLRGLRRSFSALNAMPSAAGPSAEEPAAPSLTDKDRKGDFDHRLGSLWKRLVDLSWLLLRESFLDGEKTPLEGSPSERGDGLVASVVALGMGAGDGDVAEAGAADSAWSDVGSLLRDVQRQHSLLAIIQSERMAGRLLIDEVQFEYIEALLQQPGPQPSGSMSAAAAASGLPSAGGAPAGATTEGAGFVSAVLATAEDEEAAAIQGSKISQIKDLLPDYGDGFLALCLDIYENDAEKVIQNILEGSLHPDLANLDVTMKVKPPPPAAVVEPPAVAKAKDKGKGKIIEEPPPTGKNKGKASASGEGPLLDDRGRIRTSSAYGASSSSGDVAAPSPVAAAPSAGTVSGWATSGWAPQPVSASGPAGGSSRATSATGDSTGAWGAGRFVRRQKNGPDAMGLLNDRGGAESDAIRRVAIAAANAEDLEYNDEYDDSLDELGTYGTNAGDDDVENYLDTRSRMMATSETTPSVLDTSTSGRGPPDGRASAGPRGAPRRGPPPALMSAGAPQKAKGDGILGTGAGSAGAGPSPAQSGEKGKKGPRGEKQGSQYYLKDGKLYGYKVAGGQLVSSQEEAAAILKTESETIHGLGRGGNVPIGQANGNDSNEEEDDAGAGMEAEAGGRGGEGGRGGGRGGGGRGGRGRGDGGGGGRLYARKEQNKSSVANHRRKDASLKKHMGSVGGF